MSDLDLESVIAIFLDLIGERNTFWREGTIDDASCRIIVGLLRCKLLRHHSE